MSIRRGISPPAELLPLASGLTAIGLLTFFYSTWIRLNPTSVALLFLLVVLVVATVATRRVAVAISVLAFLCFNFFYLPPVGTWTIADPQNWVALFTLLAVSLVASHLSSQVRQRAREAFASRDELARLFDLTRDILLITDTHDGVADVSRSIARRFGFDGVSICLPGAGGWRFHHSGEPGLIIPADELESLFAPARERIEFDADERTYSGHARVQSRTAAGAWLVPLRIGTRPIGLLALRGGTIDSGTRDAIAGVTAIAIERSHLLEERKEAELLRRGAELKSVMLASLSHDLKTPLTAVTLAANNLDASWLSDEQRREQVEIVRSELQRLNRLFQDIVDMARIETNAIDPELEWVEVAEVVEAAARQAEPALAGHPLEIDLGTEQTLVRLDPRLTSAALAHLLENAGQYSSHGSAIGVIATVSDDELTIAVRDHGPGISPEDRERLFERFYRGATARHHRFGTGMGLAITRGLLAVQQGRVRADNQEGGGAVFTMAIPVQRRTVPALVEEDRT